MSMKSVALPPSLITRQRLAAVVRRPGTALLETWCDDERGGWTILLPWPEEIREVGWHESDRWRELLRSIEPSAPVLWTASSCPFAGGWVGFVSYEAGAGQEGALPRPDATPEPAAWFVRHSSGLAIFGGIPMLFAPEDEIDGRARELSELLGLAPDVSDAPVAHGGVDLDDSLPGRRYLDAVSTIRGQIRDGDVYQVNLTRRLTAHAPFDPREVYLGLTKDGVPRCAALLAGDSWTIASASPEVFLEVDFGAGTAESRPIKGTLRRAGDDKGEIAALRASAKDAAEHLMIVDLVRNDLGKVAPPGCVSVPKYLTVRTLPHVHHLESTVRAERLRGVSVADSFDALFPGGSITGAPKRAAVESIRAIEPCARGVYTGAIGFIDDRGLAQFSVAIRTAVITAEETRYHAGGGVVWDSEARAEDDESRAKSAGFFRALGLEDGE